jgi:hypothetical protein
VAPTGARIALSKSRILNLNEVQAGVEKSLRENPVPSAKERRILTYYSRYGKTSPAYEELRLKYPNWRP